MLQAVLLQRRQAATAWPARPRPRARRRAAGRLRRRGCRSSSPRGRREVGEEIAADLALRAPHAPAAAGRGGRGQDRGGAARHAPGGRRGRPGGAAGAHRGARPAAPPLDHRHAGRSRAGRHVRRHGGRPCSPAPWARPPAAQPCSTPPPGTAGIVVGTHALLQEHVQFADLGLVVVDEQHRFGVEQRDALREKAGGGRPARAGHDRHPDPAHGRHDGLRRPGGLHALAASLGPRARSPPTWCPPRRSRTSSSAPGQRVREEVGLGRQAYIVCPRIGDLEGDEGDLSAPPSDEERRPPLAVLDVAELLSEGPLPRSAAAAFCTASCRRRRRTR